MRCTLFATVLFALGCMGSPLEAAPTGIHTWDAGPIEVRLLEGERAAIVQDGGLLQTIDVPYIHEDRRDGAFLLVDLDFDGNSDLQFFDGDNSGAYNLFHWFYRYDPASKTYERCADFEELHGVVIDPEKKQISSTSLGNGMGASGDTVFFESTGGCSTRKIGTLSWSRSMETGTGRATCTVGDKKLWSEAIQDDLPNRRCP